MNKEEIVYANLFKKFFIHNNQKKIDKLLAKIRKEGKFFLLREIINQLKKELSKKVNEEVGLLYLSAIVDSDIVKNYLELLLKKRVIIKEIKKDSSLILGGIFIGQNIIVDFSVKNFLKKLKL